MVRPRGSVATSQFRCMCLDTWVRQVQLIVVKISQPKIYNIFIQIILAQILPFWYYEFLSDFWNRLKKTFFF
jgi:hypothetical protein